MKKITEKVIYCKNKDGEQYVDKRGRKFCRVVIKIEGNDKLYSNLAYSKEDTDSVKIGQLYDLILEKNGDFYNWRFPNKIDQLEIRVKAIEEKMEMDEAVEKAIPEEEQNAAEEEQEKHGYPLQEKENAEKKDEIDVSEIPF